MASPGGGFHTISVAFDSSCTACHSMFIKRHSAKGNSSTPPERTLFAVNIPPYCGEEGIKNVFKDCGAISEVYLMSQPGPIPTNYNSDSIVFQVDRYKAKPFQVAYVVFKHASSVGRALALSPSDWQFISTEDNPIKTGMEKWIAEYPAKYPDQTKMQNEVDEYMRNYDQQELEAAQASKEAADADGDGWVTVPSTRKQPLTEKKKTKKNEKKKKKEKELMNFYMFQQREQKRDKIADLRRKFEEDKKKIVQMRQQRRFKPF